MSDYGAPDSDLPGVARDALADFTKPTNLIPVDEAHAIVELLHRVL
ncbi:hypothetical protein [Amycolatopsis jiangsuensis]|uniref:Uncharacterized protein n=1 Tax=Amycolatopsis jiangsuensis TaxID=1181879 RepID=A0A840J7W6_9PSEU|nr:hypothetical protein [Amycolatopsis jiangsuensis]MBB4689554.1 hypothetical protein [Amycolatopsis jiangsuensis]